MYDVLLALHLLPAATAFVTVVVFSAWAIGAPATWAQSALADAAWNVSGAGLQAPQRIQPSPGSSRST